MDVMTAIETRLTIKWFDVNNTMTAAEIDSLFALTMWAPTAFSIDNRRFVLVRDPESRAAIHAASCMKP